MFIDLKPLAERQNMSTQQVADRLRLELNRIAGIRAWTVPIQDLHNGARLSSSKYQLALWSSDIDLLQQWAPKVLARVKNLPGVIDATSDRGLGGLRAEVSVDRQMAARLGVRMIDIDSALNSAFAQRQISTIYTTRNRYRVILEVARKDQRDPSNLNHIYVPGKDAEVPLSAVAHFVRTIAPTTVNHRGQFPSIAITYNLAANAKIEETTASIAQVLNEMHIPEQIHADFTGDILSFKRFMNMQPLLLLIALIAIYIVLGIRYESLVHPLTIISTLPSAGLGALLALQMFGSELSVIAFVGIILLIGIVKKNGIMMVSFALEVERKRRLSPQRAIHEACLERFRPILMTTMAAMLGALPLLIAGGPGSELRRPLGITIIGGLLVSQVLTLYTTPVIYLFLGKLHQKLGGMTSTLTRTRQLGARRKVLSLPPNDATTIADREHAEIDH